MISGAAGPTSFAGCAVSRADVVPATDRSPDRYTRYDAFIAEASRLYALPEALIRAIIKVESDYDPRVVSCAAAKGLMQLMPDVQKEQHVEHVFEPRENILGGTRLLRLNANRFKGDLVLTIAAYHAGRARREVPRRAALRDDAAVREDGAQALLPVQSAQTRLIGVTSPMSAMSDS